MKISVIIPTYNRADLLPRTIGSVLGQTLKDLELVVVDDGSTDNTKEVVMGFSKKDPRVKYIYQKNSGAPAKPKNTGLKEAQGEFVAFLDHDDEWMPHKLEAQLSLFRNSKNIGLTSCNALIVDEINEFEKEYKIDEMLDVIPALLERNFIFCSSGVVVKKEVFEKVGLFDENYKFGDDWDMWLRIANHYKLDFVREPLYKFYRHKKTVTNTMVVKKKLEDYYYGLNKHIDLYKKYPKQLSFRLLIMGRMCYLSGDMSRGIKLFCKSIIADPMNLKSYLNLAFSLLGSGFYGWFVNLRRSKIN